MRTYMTLLVDTMDTVSIDLTPESGIPFINIGGSEAGRNGIQLTTYDAPAEQVAWLRKLASEVEDLARKVERFHGIDSPTEVVNVPLIGVAR
jgi:hypothetical protein